MTRLRLLIRVVQDVIGILSAFVDSLMFVLFGYLVSRGYFVTVPTRGSHVSAKAPPGRNHLLPSLRVNRRYKTTNRLNLARKLY